MTISMSPKTFKEELHQSAVGWCFEYHRGHLALDRMNDAAARNLAKSVWRHYRNGWVDLFQKRHGPHDYSYIAKVKRHDR